MDLPSKIVVVLLATNVILSAVKRLLEVLHVAAPAWLAPILSAVGKGVDLLSANPDHKTPEPPQG